MLPAIFLEAEAYATNRRYWLKHAESPLFILIANGYLLDLTCRFRRLELLHQFIVECLKGIIVLCARSFLRDRNKITCGSVATFWQEKEYQL